MVDYSSISRCYVNKTGEIVEQTFVPFLSKDGDAYTSIRDGQQNVTRTTYENTVKAYNGLSKEHQSLFKKEAAYALSRSLGHKMPPPLSALTGLERERYEAALVAAGLASSRPDAAGLHARKSCDLEIVADHNTVDKPAYNTRYYRVGAHRIAESNMNPYNISYAMEGNTFKFKPLLKALEQGDQRGAERVLKDKFGKSNTEVDQILCSNTAKKLGESLMQTNSVTTPQGAILDPAQQRLRGGHSRLSCGL